ncbi:hypothetical protein [Prevotella sp.]
MSVPAPRPPLHLSTDSMFSSVSESVGLVLPDSPMAVLAKS